MEITNFIYFLAAGILLLNAGECSGGVETQAEIGDNCQKNEECHLGPSGELSFCDNGTCACIPSAVLKPETKICFKTSQIIGDPCEFDDQCTKGSTGSWSGCRNGQCLCVALAIPSLDNRRCLGKTALIGGPCELTAQCTNAGGPDGSWKACMGGKCQCAASAINEPGQHTCYPIRELINEPCTIQQQCTAKIGNLTECTKDSTCQCVAGAVPNREERPGIRPNSRCLPANVLIGQECVEKIQCVGYPGISSVCSHTGLCDCMPAYTPSAKLDDCLYIQNNLGGECTESQQCQRGDPGPLSECRDGKYCNCTSEAISEALKNVCYRKASLIGDSCEVDMQCMANLERSLCFSNQCACLNDAVESLERNKCLLKKNLDEDCVDHNQCRHMGQAICSNSHGKTCQCDEGHVRHPSVQNKCIRLARFIGEQCNEHEIQCRDLKDSHCNQSTKQCECVAGEEVVSENGKLCLKRQGLLNATCVETRQCLVENSLCLPVPMLPVGSKQCHCDPNGYIRGKENENGCFPIRQNIGDHCNDIVQCEHIGLPNNVLCIDHQCNCPAGAQFHNRRCITPAKLHDPCDDINQCHAGVNNYTACVSQGENSLKFCICLPQAMERNNSCWATKFVGDACQNSMECGMTIIGPVFCDAAKGQCACEDNHSADKTGLMCSNGAVFGSKFTLIILISGVLSVVNSMLY